MSTPSKGRSPKI